MAIHRNSQKVFKRYRGTQEILASYRGDQQFYSSTPALIRSAPDYWYTLNYNEYPYKSYGSKDISLTFVSKYFHDRGGHAWVANAKSKIDVLEDWSDAAWSASCWLQKTGSPGNTETLFGRGVAGGPLISVWSNGSNQINVDIGESPAYSYSSSATVPASGWYHLAVTCELYNGRNLVTVYVDGVSAAQFFAANAGIPSFPQSKYVSFGNHPDPSANYPFDGNIDDIALWSRTLSPGEVSAIYRGGRGVVPTKTPKFHFIETIPGITHWLPMTGGFDDVRFPSGHLPSAISEYNRDTAVSFNSEASGNNTLNTWGNSQTALTNLNSAWPSGGSIGAWFKMSSEQPAGGGMILHKFTGAADFTHELYLNTDAALGYCYAGAKIGGTWWDVRVTTHLINNGSWYFVYAEVIQNPSTPSSWNLRVRVYNTSGSGVSNQVTKTGLSTSGFPANDNLYIGGSGSGQTMMGEFDDVIVANRAISASELAAIAAAGRSDPVDGRHLFAKSDSMRTGTLSRGVWTTVGSQTIPYGMEARLAMHNLSWAQAKSGNDRMFRIRTNNHGVLATTVDEGLTLHLNYVLSSGDIVYFEAMSNSDTASFRNVTKGHWLIREI